jgi:hypothetical protein
MERAQLSSFSAHGCFNNLLQAVHGNLDLIRRRPEDPARVSRLAENGIQAAERGANLTAQLLAFSRSQKLELRTTAIAPLVAGMDDILKRSLGHRGSGCASIPTEKYSEWWRTRRSLRWRF